MTWFIGQSIFIIAAAFLLGILVGWLIWGRILRPDRTGSGTPQRGPEAAPRADGETEPAQEPVRESEPVATVPDAEPERELVLVGAKPASAPDEAASLVAVQAAPVVLVQAVAADSEQPSDDLERIEGIGPKMAGALIKAGIRTYAQLAVAEQETLRNAIEAEGLRFAPSIVTWSRQAQLLADGDEAAFEDLTRRLVAGRDEGRE